jgi:hypothetical protein
MAAVADGAVEMGRERMVVFHAPYLPCVAGQRKHSMAGVVD